jgi:hypothetical protein
VGKICLKSRRKDVYCAPEGLGLRVESAVGLVAAEGEAVPEEVTEDVAVEEGLPDTVPEP